LINTFASIAIPSVKATAARPGNVKVAWRMDSRATSNSRFMLRANTETAPKAM
jgi:hypothetical protein